jgi:predicted ATPase
LVAFLRDKDLLLLLDNCEHLIDACAQLTDELLRVCPRLRMLTSSREPLGIGGESIFQVPALSLPDPAASGRPDEAMRSEAVQLFVARASAVQASFELASENALTVVQICQRLDGITLAIELAAARVRVLTVE